MHVFVRKVVCLIACPLLLYPLLSQQVVNAFRSASAPRSQQVSSATQGMAQNPSWRSKIPPPRAAHRTIYAPLLALDDPALAELTLNNNGTQELPIVVTLFTRLGQPIPCSPIVIGPVQVQTLHMSDLVPAMEKNRDSAHRHGHFA